MSDAEAVAKEIATKCMHLCSEEIIPTVCKNHVGACITCIADVLTTYAAQQVREAERRAIAVCCREVCSDCRRGHEVKLHPASMTWVHGWSEEGYDTCRASGIWTATGRRATQEPK